MKCTEDAEELFADDDPFVHAGRAVAVLLAALHAAACGALAQKSDTGCKAYETQQTLSLTLQTRYYGHGYSLPSWMCGSTAGRLFPATHLCPGQGQPTGGPSHAPGNNQNPPLVCTKPDIVE